jgi:antitoxin ChpS
MSALVIRQSGGASIISLPKGILKTLNLHIGSSLDLSIEHNKIVLTPLIQEETLEILLKVALKNN